VSSPQTRPIPPNRHKVNAIFSENSWHFSYAQPAIIKSGWKTQTPGHVNEADEFDVAVRQIVGKRLTYDQLTRKSSNAFHSKCALGKETLRAREEEINYGKDWRRQEESGSKKATCG
jgi:hypothetical protein